MEFFFYKILDSRQPNQLELKHDLPKIRKEEKARRKKELPKMVQDKMTKTAMVKKLGVTLTTLAKDLKDLQATKKK